MKLELSPQAIDTLNLALQAMQVTTNATMIELRAAAQAAQQAEQRAAGAKALKAKIAAHKPGKKNGAAAPTPQLPKAPPA